MKIRYKIIETYPDEHQIVVRYYTDRITEEMLATDVRDGRIARARTDVAIDVPIPFPGRDQLHDLISRSGPAYFFYRKEQLVSLDPEESMREIKQMLDQEFSFDYEPPKPIIVKRTSVGSIPVTTL